MLARSGKKVLRASALVLLPLGLLTRCTERDDGATAPGSDAGDAGDGGHVVECVDGGHASELRCTGLYSDFARKEVAPNALAYSPAFPLWSDGAVKSRFIYLPPGTQIDTTDMDEWRFPPGTKFWKEFALDGRRVETRLIEKLTDGKWRRQTFKWSDDESTATELVDGDFHVRGTTYEIPKQAACLVCHDGRIDGVLGFEAVSLGNEGATGLTLSELVARGLLTKPPTMPLTVPGDATERPALAWLHANCGTSCHNLSPDSRANFTYLHLRLNVAQLGSVMTTDTYRTSVSVVSAYQPNDGEVLFRIEPGQPSRSVMFLRSTTRDVEQQVQMPPIATHVVDDAGVAIFENWIRALKP